MTPTKRGRSVAASPFSVVLATAGIVYAAALALASRETAASLWGIHLASFLPSPARAIVLGAALLGAALLTWGAVADRRAKRSASTPRGSPKTAPGRSTTITAILPLYALPVLAAIFWELRVRTHFLGDGIVWLGYLTSGQFPGLSEPLSTEAWHGYVRALQALGIRVDAASLAALPVVCGIAAAALLWLLAREIAPGPKSRIAGAALLLTLGTSQLYFGYIESYPIISVLVLLYLLLAARAMRRGRPDPLAGLALALVAASHLITIILAPSYVWLIVRTRGSLVRKALLLVLPVAVGAALFAALRFDLNDLLRPFRTVGQALQGGTGSFGFTVHGLLSARRWLDLANLALLVLPAPLILVVARASLGKGATAGAGLVVPFLVLAAVPGLAAAVFLVVPSSPAQDWDLLAIVLLPAAVAMVAAGIPALERAHWTAAAGLCLLGGAGLSSFVLVNADESAGIRRFESLVGEGAALGPHERAYGNEKLATYWAGRGDFSRAFRHARRAVDAEPANPRYWVKAGGALVALDRAGEAIPYFEEALRREPGRADANYNLGICYAKAKRYGEAIAAFQAAVLADPDRPEYRHNLGVVLYASGKADSARLVWTEVLHRWPGYPLTARSMDLHFMSR